MQNLTNGDVRCVEFDDGTRTDEWYFRDEKNAKNKFNELAKTHDLTAKGCYAKNGWGKRVWMGKIVFED